MENFINNFYEMLDKAGNNYEKERIIEALNFSRHWHDGQKRDSGEEYICHPIEVAKILVSYDSDTDSIIAALLHDIVEDTPVTLDMVKKLFGTEVALLVDGVTKLGKISYSSKEEQQIENLRKMLLAMAKDIRVILIKLADRLHNLRTLDSVSPERQRQKALETIEVYAPLAHRLGIQNLKIELEDLSLKYLDNVGYTEIVENLKIFHENNHMFDEIKNIIVDKLESCGLHAVIDGRVKHVYSIYRKMFTQNKTFDEVYDLYAYRIIVDKVLECYNVLGYMHDVFKAIPGRLKDYIATPKPNMYQSLHTTVAYKSFFFELQIRTVDMHRTAEMGIAAHWKYKQGVFGNDPTDSKLEWVRNLLEVQQDVNDADDFMKTFKIDLFSDQVFVSTPKGDIICLPAESSVIDFAYAIHSAIGNKMIGAKINGRMMELITKLQNGDVVEIVTSENSNGPSRDWLKIVCTNEAKNKIKQWFKKEKREDNIIQGRDDLEKELRRNLINLSKVDKNELFESIMKRYSVIDLDDLYATIGFGGVAISKILPKIKDEYNRLIKSQEIIKIPTITKRKNINGIIVEEIDNCLVKLAGCCVPLPGDEIMGFVTRGYGVSVHKADCPNVQKADKERLVHVKWDGEMSDYFAASLKLTAISRIDLIADITLALAAIRVVTHSINVNDPGDGCIYVYVTIDVHSLTHLESVAKKLRKITNVLDVSRGIYK